MSSIAVSVGAMPPAAIVFDCDGLLLDTEGCWSAGQIALFARHGQAFEPEHKQALVGRSMAEAWTDLRAVPGPARARCRASRTSSWRSWSRSCGGWAARPCRGPSSCSRCSGGRAPRGVASNSPRPVFEAAVAAAGVSEWFEAAVSADDVERPKPAPDIYVEACRRLGADPADADRTGGHGDGARGGARGGHADDRRALGVDGCARRRRHRRIAGRSGRPRRPRAR